MSFIFNSILSSLIVVYCGRSWRSVCLLNISNLDIADMTAEGAFPLGAAVVASQQAERNPLDW